MTIKPFEVRWREAAVDKILKKVRDYEFPDHLDGTGWKFGCDAGYLREFRDYWLNDYDAEAAQAELNRFPQFSTELDGFTLHFHHIVGESSGKRPLLLSHGWPISTYEFWQVIEKLSHPSRFGGKASDAFDLVIPSIPGFGYSQKPRSLFNQRQTGALFNKLMVDVLGYESYFAQGGDWGEIINTFIAIDHQQRLRALHFTTFLVTAPDRLDSREEKNWAAERDRLEYPLHAYNHLQATKPQSLAWAVSKDPMAQASWFIERFHDWADLRHRSFEEVYPKPFLVTNIMTYLMTETFASSVWYDAASAEAGVRMMQKGRRVETPTTFALFPQHYHTWPPRSFAEKLFNVVGWAPMDHGGHFAAVEAPDLFVNQLRRWANGVRAEMSVALPPF
jgi:pimeloyl-ACP methyl ester carboxylesterase